MRFIECNARRLEFAREFILKGVYSQHCTMGSFSQDWWFNTQHQTTSLAMLSYLSVGLLLSSKSSSANGTWKGNDEEFERCVNFAADFMSNVGAGRAE